MDLIKFIKDSNLTNYIELKDKLEADPYFLKIKEDPDLPDLFLIHTQDKSDFNNIIVRQCNGIIMEKNTLKIICYSFEKCIDDDTKLDERMNTENMQLQFAMEGALIRLYFYQNNWFLATKKCINASKSKWISSKNFLKLFEECLSSIQNLEKMQEKLNINCCYTFILMHPENNIIPDNKVMKLFHISTRNLITLEETDENIGIEKIYSKSFHSSEIEPMIDSLKNETNYIYEGYMIIDNNYNRQKFKSNIFKNVRNIWGNTNNRFYRYLELRKDFNLLNQYLSIFPYDKQLLFEYEENINKLAFKILECYKNKHVLKKDDKIPFYYSKLIYKLHGDFMKTRVITNHEKVMVEIFDLDPKQICFIFNKVEKDECDALKDALKDSLKKIELNNMEVENIDEE
jgi:hypothetical protein